MKTSLEWLTDFLPGAPLEATRAAEALTHGGFPVEIIEQHGSDFVIDVEVTSNRGDCLSHRGVARELSALLNLPMHQPDIAVTETTALASSAVSVAIEDLQRCPHYTARIIRGVKVGPSPAWMQRRLEAVGLRPINNVVDVTNYVMFELGQPLHAFDFDKLQGGKVVVRNARAGEKLTSLDGHERKLDPTMLVIADANRAVALAGVMGGIDSEVSVSTVNVLLESARFDPLSVRKTARQLAMKSDSSYRFERRIDPSVTLLANLRAAQLIIQTAGGTLLNGVAEAGTGSVPPKSLSLRLAKLKQVLGIDISMNDAMSALGRLGLAPTSSNDSISCTIPTHRLDLNIEVDLVEEVARVLGYDRIPIQETISIRLTPDDLRRRALDRIRDSLVASGYFESITVTFISDLLTPDFTPDGSTLAQVEAITRKADAALRPSLIPALLESIRRNEANGTEQARLFEVGSVFSNDASGILIESRRLAVVGGTDLHDARGAIELLLNRLDAELPVLIRPGECAGFSSGATGEIIWGDQRIGYLGIASKTVCDKLGLRHMPVVAELDVNRLIDATQHVPQLKPLPRFPAIRRDLSLVVSDSVRYEEIDSLVRELKLEHLENLAYVTTYRGKPLEKGIKSVTITLEFRSPTSTLTNEQVETSVQRAVAAAKDRLKASLRV